MRAPTTDLDVLSQLDRPPHQLRCAGDLATWRLVVSESGRSPEVGRIFYERAPHHLEQLLAGYFDRQVAAGRLRDEGTLPMAQLLISMCVAQQTRRLLGVEHAANHLAAEQFSDYFMRLFSVN